MKQQVFTVIMAGGGGTRFWPLSRQNHPKQLLNLSGKDIMLNETISRMEPLVSRDHTFVVTNETQANLMEELILPGVDKSHILREPMGRNTAPCILYAAMKLRKLYSDDGIMCVLAADHHIEDLASYVQVMKLAIRTADQTNQAVTIGISPTYGATGYGYIALGKAVEAGVYQVEGFVEKPCQEKADEYVEAGNYLWNSGMFVWKISTILSAFEQYLPQMVETMKPVEEVMGTSMEQEVLAKVYPALESISVDYGIMEQLDQVLVLPGDFGWSDVGSLDGLGVFHEADADGNIFLGNVLARESHNCIVKSEKPLIALNGVEGLMVIDTPDALLICPKDRAQDVKYIVEQLKAEGSTQI